MRCSRLLCACSGVAFSLACRGQAAPTAGTTGSVAGPHTTEPGLLKYSVTASNSVIFGYNGVNGASDSVNIAGTADYVSGNARAPFSVIYSGGYLFGNSGQPSSSFQNLGVSQALNGRKWTLIGSDVVSYLPVTPRFGVGGVPGVGDVGTLPISTGLVPGDAVLTNYGRRITNDVTGGADYRFTGRTGIRTSGSYITQHFIDGNGIENDELYAGAELDHQVSRATMVGGGYTFTRATYPQNGFTFISHGVSAIVQHTFNAKFSMTASGGPQWTSGSNSAIIPSRLGAAASVGAYYLLRENTFSATYSRGTSTGSGALYGATSDTVNVAVQHTFHRDWSAGLFASFGHAQSLSNLPGLYTSATSFTAGIQATRRISDHWSAFASYAAQTQSISQVVATDNAFNGTAHVITAGITYSPRPIRLGRR